jgi:hypothetical protein
MKLALLISIFFISSAFGAPFFFKCGEGGTLKSKIQPREIDSFLSQMIKSNGEQQTINYLCGANKTCIEEYRRIITLGKFSERASTRLLTNFELNKTQLYSKKISEEEFSLAKKVKLLGRSLLMCQEQKQKLDPLKLLRGKCIDCKEKVVLFYPYYNNYMYASGCRGLLDESKCDHLLETEAVIKSIDRSLIMGADPYTTLAIGLMEKFNEDFQTSITWEKTIPPRFWLSGAMSCHQKSALDGVRELLNKDGKLVDKNLLKLGESMEKLLNHEKKSSTKPEKSYFCYKQGDKESKVSEIPITGSCCIELPFKPEVKQSAKKIQSSLMFHYIKTQIKSPLTCKKTKEEAELACQKGRWDRLYEADPAFNIQRFQGYSKLHGGSEPVNAWRSGVNHYKTPVYGHQVMDYLINSLYTNPLLNKLVSDAQEKLKLAPTRSLICSNLESGVYVVDSDYYFNKGRDAKRLGTIFNKKDKDWDKLTKTQRRVMLTEFGDPKVRDGDIEINSPGLLSHFKKEERKILANLTNLDFSSITKLSKGVWKSERESQKHSKILNKAQEIYFNKFYEPRDTRGKASNFPWNRLTDDNFQKLLRKLN